MSWLPLLAGLAVAIALGIALYMAIAADDRARRQARDLSDEKDWLL